MNALFDFVPQHCPYCGTKITWKSPTPTIRPTDDYYHLASFVCPCGLTYQYAPTATILDTADTAGGDLKSSRY